MAELDIGKHCEIESCKQKVQTFCLSCVTAALECSAWNTEAEMPIPVQKCVLGHAETKPDVFQASVRPEGSGAGSSALFSCTFENCKGKELLPVICPQCQEHFCLAHRHQDDHKCERLEKPKPRMAATQELVQKIVESKKKNAPPSRGRKGAKNSATAAKVALMKLKLHASGDTGLPQTERTYFQVFLPEEAAASSLPMFFSSRWSVGKAVDFAASQAGLKNNNNVLAARKLRLCHPETGTALKLDASLQSLLSLPDSPLYNGGSVILEYLDNESPGVEDVTAYIPSS